MRKGMTPARNRALVLHLMDSTLDFQDWLTRNLGILTPGLTPNPWTGELHTTHSWRIMHRRDLAGYEKKFPEQWQIVELPPGKDGRFEVRDNDAVLLLKEWESSKQLSQPPLVLFPACLIPKLLSNQPAVQPRSLLGQRSIKQYSFTAQRIAKEPWLLTVGSDWLLSWIKRNAQGQLGIAPACRFVLQDLGVDRVQHHQISADPRGWMRYAPEEVAVRPVVVNVHANPKASNNY